MSTPRAQYAIVALGEPPYCKLGYPTTQLRRLLGMKGIKWAAFSSWSQGRTFVLCDGRLWNPMTQQYERTECAVEHGTVIYVQDVERFLRSNEREA